MATFNRARVCTLGTQEDMIRLQTIHFKGDRRKYRKFELDDRRLPLEYAEDEGVITVTSGKTSLVITKAIPCRFTYLYDGKKITGIGDFAGRPMLSYMATPEGPFMRGQLEVDVGEKIRTPQISMAASAVSAIPAVREFLLGIQKITLAKARGFKELPYGIVDITEMEVVGATQGAAEFQVSDGQRSRIYPTVGAVVKATVIHTGIVSRNGGSHP